MYIEGPPLYCIFHMQVQNKQDRIDKETLEAAGEKGQKIKKVTKLNESKLVFLNCLTIKYNSILCKY